MRNRRALRFLTLTLLVFAGSLPAQAQTRSFDGGWVDLPVGWHATVAGDYRNQDGTAGLTIKGYAASRYSSARQLFDEALGALGATGQGVEFKYSGSEGYIGEVSFRHNDVQRKGYLVALLDSEKAVTLLGYADLRNYGADFDEILSAIDSYSRSAADLRRPGVISQFFYPFPSPKRVPTALYVSGRQFEVGLDVREIDASQVVIDRETRVLARNKQINVPAWRRFYRMIFRDNYHRLDPFLTAIETGLELTNDTPYEKAVAVLKWMQGFLYARTGTLADLSSPVLTAATQTGDCDSRTLLYSILLEHMGVGTVLMVSARYSHSMVGVLVPGKGARYEAGGRAYLVAELTADVDIGMIDRSMADPSGWVPVTFGLPE